MNSFEESTGNLVTDHRGYDCKYDYENRLIRVLDVNDVETAVRAYDALGRRSP